MFSKYIFFGYLLINYDIKTAYLWGDMEEDEKVPVSLPKGMQEFHEETVRKLSKLNMSVMGSPNVGLML